VRAVGRDNANNNGGSSINKWHPGSLDKKQQAQKNKNPKRGFDHGETNLGWAVGKTQDEETRGSSKK